MAQGRQFNENYSQKNKLRFDGSQGIATDYPIETSTTLYQKGQVVTLTATGTVEIAATGNIPFGHVTVANILNDPNSLGIGLHHQGHVTVQEKALDHNYGYAKGGAIATGALVEADGQSTVDAEFMDYIVATGGVYAAGICVKGAAVGEEIEVALFPSPVYVA